MMSSARERHALMALSPPAQRERKREGRGERESKFRREENNCTSETGKEKGGHRERKGVMERERRRKREIKERGEESRLRWERERRRLRESKREW